MSTPVDHDPPCYDGASFGSIEILLFDSLVHHLIEKGLLTRNDALSVVQTVAEVVGGQANESGQARQEANAVLARLERIYASFEALPDRSERAGMDANNVHRLRPPLHGENPRFPKDDN